MNNIIDAGPQAVRLEAVLPKEDSRYSRERARRSAQVLLSTRRLLVHLNLRAGSGTSSIILHFTALQRVGRHGIDFQMNLPKDDNDSTSISFRL